MKKIMKQINGYDIEYVEYGKENDVTIVFAHGLGGSVEQWNEQMNYFSKEYHVVTFSLYGHGGSSKPKEYYRYTIEEYRKTITCLFEKLEISSCIWVGNSMGGVLGYEMLKITPEKIEMIITNGTTPQLIMPKVTAKLVCFFDKLLIRIMKFDGYIKFASKNSSKKQSTQEILYNIFKEASPQAIIASHLMLANYSYIETINKTDVPIVLIKATYDSEINKYIMKIDSILKQNENVKFVEFENVGHIANLEEPMKYNYLVDEIIRKYS